MEQLIIKAIREFKKQHSDAEIRVVYVTESNGSFKKIQSATFCIEYVTEPGGEYFTTYVSVEKEAKQ